MQQPTLQIGTPMHGGFFAGALHIHGEQFGLIVAPKAAETKGKWLNSYTLAPDTNSFFDGLANTQGMAAAGSAIAKTVLALDTNGQTDWYIPSRDELELLYRHFKPNTAENYQYRSGDNPSSIPAGYPYTPKHPQQTVTETFQTGHSEALEDGWYWSSTQGSANGAWKQNFSYGIQGWLSKLNAARVRPVRRFKLNP